MGATSAVARAADSEFLKEVRRQVQVELDRPGVEARAWSATNQKTVLLLVWFLSSYGAAVFGPGGLLLIAAALSTGLSLAGLAFNVQHDGAHGSFGRTTGVNHAAARLLDFLGMSSYLWRWKHNVLHHGSPNVLGIDDDVDAQPLLRLHPGQRWRWYHRWQWIYAWPLYALLTIQWIFFSDLKELITGRIGTFSFPAPSKRDLALFWLAKLQFIIWALLLPAAAHGLASSLLFFLTFEMAGGLMAALCFQLAHAVADADHLTPDEAQTMGWADRQLSATVDFSTEGRLLNWYLGGLNYQAVHHLFPGVNHHHYPWIAKIVRFEARRQGLRYREAASFLEQLLSHLRLLRQLGVRE